MKKRAFTIFLCLMILFSVLGAQGVLTVSGVSGLGGSDSDDGNAPCGTPLPILMYHTVLPGRRDRYVIPPEVLEEDLKYIKSKGYQTVTVADLIGFQEKNIPLPRKPIMLTFDDGNRTNYIHAFPLLKKYNMKAVMSVVGAYVDSNYFQSGELDHSQHIYLTYEQIKEMRESGLVEIQNHSYDLHKSGKRCGMKKMRGESYEEYEEFLAADLTRFEKRIGEKAGFCTNAVAYPFGAYSKDTVHILQKLGYKAALTCTEGINYMTRRTNLFLLKRFNRAYGRSAEKILSRDK